MSYEELDYLWQFGSLESPAGCQGSWGAILIPLSGTLAGGIKNGVVDVAAGGASPLGFKGKLQILRTKSGRSALHGAVKLLLFLIRVWLLKGLRFAQLHGPQRCLLLSLRAVLSMLEGPTGCDPAFLVIWARFRMVRRYLLVLRLEEVRRVNRMLDCVAAGCEGMSLFMCSHIALE